MDAIYNSIPHRPPFLFIDKIVEITETGAVCERTIHADEDFFQGHYPGNPIMPGVLLCESTFQAAAIYLVDRMRKAGESIEKKTPILSRILEAKFKRQVKPGDVIRIEVTFKETIKGFHFLRGVVRKDGKPALAIEFVLAVIEEDGAS